MGVVRVSRTGDRAGEQFVSPSEQAERIRAACSSGGLDNDGLELLEIHEELNVSGGAPLEQRTGLRRAVEQIEAGEADVLLAVYFDRIVRSLAVQAEVVEQVEKAGGKIVALDIGQVTSDTAAHWLSATMLGAVSEYHRRTTRERTQGAKRRAIERGVPTFPRIVPGYRLRKDGEGKTLGLEPDPETKDAVAEAFELRADGASIAKVRAHLAAHGIRRSFHGTQSLLASRIVRGELNFGDLANENAHQAIVPADLWQRVQRTRVTRGRRAKSERLLARLGVLRCGSCGGLMAIGGTGGGTRRRYLFYRCSPTSGCTARVTVSADLVERLVVEDVRRRLKGSRGSAAVAKNAVKAEKEAERAEKELGAAVRAFSGLDDVEEARERLLELRERRDEATATLRRLQAATAPSVTLRGDADWGLLSLDEQRALIRAVIERVEVSPGRGPDRVTIKARGQ